MQPGSGPIQYIKTKNGLVMEGGAEILASRGNKDTFELEIKNKGPFDMVYRRKDQRIADVFENPDIVIHPGDPWFRWDIRCGDVITFDGESDYEMREAK